MKNYILLTLLVALALFVVGFSAYKIGNAPKNEQAIDTQNDEYVVDPSDMYKVEDATTRTTALEITANERKWLVFMREEEKLARDVYTTLGNEWNLSIFSNIASSEQTHADAVKALLIRYGVEDPSVSDSVGVFTSPVIQQLYDDLTAEGRGSSLDALTVGAIIEDLDINDLDTAISETNKTDILQVYENLKKGSRNHLRAFIKSIEKNGGTYTPKYISQELFNSIISSPQEKGRI